MCVCQKEGEQETILHVCKTIYPQYWEFNIVDICN